MPIRPSFLSAIARAALVAAMALSSPVLASESASMSDKPQPPIAEQRPYSYERHGVTVQDPWHWLRDQGYPKVDDADVLAYLESENRWFEAAMQPHQALTDALFEEIGRAHV